VKALPKPGSAGQAQGVAQDGANPPFPGGRYQVALLEATVHVPSNDFRGATAQAEHIAADIAQLPGFSADVVESPLDTNPANGLQGRYPEQEPATMDARFVLRVIREGPPPPS
jgi:hypothetical protein